MSKELRIGSDTSRHSTSLVSETTKITAWAKSARWQRACAALENLSAWRLVADLVVYNALHVGLKTQWRRAWKLLGDMKQLQLQENIITSTTVMKSLAAHWPRARLLLTSPGLKANAMTYDAAVTVCQVAGRWQEVLLITKQMELPDFLIFCKAVSACCESLAWQMALDLLTSGGLGLQLDLVACSTVMVAAQKMMEWRSSLALLNLWRCGDIDDIAMNIASNGLGKASKWESAALFHSDLAVTSGSWPWLMALSGVLELHWKRCEVDVVALNALGGVLQPWQRSIRLLAETRRYSLEEDIITCSSTMKAFESASYWRQVFCVFRDLPQNLQAANAVCFGTAVDAAASVFRWREALCLAEDGTTDLAMLSSCIVACGEAKEWRWALRCFHGGSDVAMYGAVMSAFEVAGQWQEALLLLKNMSDNSLQPNVIHYSAVISACEKGGAWENAIALLEDLLRQRLEPDVICYNAVISACEGSVTAAALESANLRALNSWRIG